MIFQGSFEHCRDLLLCLGDQLVNLTVTKTINAQVPYLLRTLLPHPLLFLRSLGIDQGASNHHQEVTREGALWREDEDGNVTKTSKRKAKSFIDSIYITSLARCAPNLEELGLDGACRLPIVRIRLLFAVFLVIIFFPRHKASALSKLLNLKRLYLYGDGLVYFEQDYSQHKFLEEMRLIAQRSSSLESITCIRGDLHQCNKIQRSVEGDFELVERPGCGRMIGWEDAVFPGLL
jgi:hypothetical protein